MVAFLLRARHLVPAASLSAPRLPEAHLRSVLFTDGLTPQQQAQATSDAMVDHPEQQLLAYVFGKFAVHGLLGIETETERCS